jgi:hypothetical protein
MSGRTEYAREHRGIMRRTADNGCAEISVSPRLFYTLLAVVGSTTSLFPRSTIDRFFLDSQDLPLSYDPIGIVRAETTHRGSLAADSP